MMAVLAVVCSMAAPKLFAAENTGRVTLHIGGRVIDASLPDSPIKASRDDLLHWITAAANAVAVYYGKFPVEHLTLNIRSGRGAGIWHGVTFATGGGLINITLGQDTSPEKLHDDWMLTHEMVHLAFPSMERNQGWIEEGSATYVEPVARARAGQMSVEEVWKQFVKDMPQGQPEEGDRGLDLTRTWGRVYWGGALFCLVADVQIREQTHSRKGLQDALAAIDQQGGTIDSDWDIEQAFRIGDRATKTKVLQTLYQEWRDHPVKVDLDQLWQRLGVSINGDKVKFNDKAPLASVRMAITAPAQSLPPSRPARSR
jgi:hypothetical protein